jgi:ABC-type cobalamin/Fe3+-siderophores transport system ATPase subunit
MKLNKITFDNYKNLSREYSFEQANKYVALIGLNGSGKSNLLEAISLLFAHTMGIEVDSPFAQYRLTYDIRGHRVDITEGDSLANGTISEDDVPSSLIACYSGEDNRLWNSGFGRYYVDFFNKAIRGGDYKPKVIYINKYCWKIAFLSLLFSEKGEVKSFISDKLHINTESVYVRFFTKNGANPQPHDASNWYVRVGAKYPNTQILINDLKSNEDVDLNCIKYPGLTPDQIVFYYLYFLHMPDKQGTLGLEADKLIEKIEISVNGYDFDNLSEGEKKLILIECITNVLGDESSLILLDEPDAHTHIAMKKDLLKLISEFEGQTIMTTHSPMFLNKRWEGFVENNIYYMHDGKIENTVPLKNLAELTDNEIDYFEGSFILSSKKILVVEGKYDDKYLKKAINIFARRDAKYNRLNDVTIFSANSAGSAEVIYNQILSDCIERIEKLVFLFDYDDGGWKEGWKKIEKIPNRGTKIIPMFYQDSYNSVNYPTTDEDVSKANGGSKTIKSDKSYMVEDLFSENAYAQIVEPVIRARKHRDFRNLPYGKKGTAGRIKEYIEDNYDKFSDESYDGFKAVLDELLNVF